MKKKTPAGIMGLWQDNLKKKSRDELIHKLTKSMVAHGQTQMRAIEAEEARAKKNRAGAVERAAKYVSRKVLAGEVYRRLTKEAKRNPSFEQFLEAYKAKYPTGAQLEKLSKSEREWWKRLTIDGGEGGLEKWWKTLNKP
ncbi:MAG: hypothetical protein FJY40_08975 [Betaproteobacteria bacterium]|nr:hypothetical protein [Betaproteobacteria bacterium]